MTRNPTGVSIALVTERTGSVIVYRGKRGKTFRIRYRDTDGARIIETLGSEKDGWSESKARDILRERLVDVKRDRIRKTKPVTLADFAAEWVDVYPVTQGLKRSTTNGYISIIQAHIAGSKLGRTVISAVGVDEIDRYVAEKIRAGLSPSTVNRHLNLLSLVLTSARKRHLIRDNPVHDVKRPREPRRRWTILTPAEVARVAKAFTQLAAAAPTEADHVYETRAWIEQARVVFLLVVSCGLRRGEVLGLHWRSVALATSAILRVEATWVRHRFDTPKSEASERTVPIPPTLADELFQHRGRTFYSGDDELVFCQPDSGKPLNPKMYTATLRAALKKAGITRTMRPFHDGRHTAITSDAASGNAPVSIQTRAGHSDFRTTQRYIDLAGREFREDGERLGEYVLGSVVAKSAGKRAKAKRDSD